MIPCYAIIPHGENLPSALFMQLEDAMDWGLRAYGRDAFRIRRIEVAKVEKADRAGAERPT